MIAIMHDINDATISRYDRSGMVGMVLATPDQMREGWKRAAEISLRPPSQNGSLVICGMGGSAIGAELARDLAGAENRFPIHVERGYQLPRFADSNTTVICISYSGNTEEVIALFREARSRDCGLGVITSGGILERESAESGVGMVKVRGGLPPRAAIGYLLTPLLKFLSEWGAIRLDQQDFSSLVETTESALENLAPAFINNPAMKISEKLFGRIPLIYSGGSLLRGAAYRWKCQFNENSKVMAFSNIFPELGHNEIMGWDCPEEIREKMSVIMLNDRDDHPRVKKRMAITASMLEDNGVEVIKIESGSWFPEGAATRAQRLLSAVILGDMASVYLALRRGIDPAPIDRIDLVKDKLRME